MTGLAGKAEELLNKVDMAAGQAITGGKEDVRQAALSSTYSAASTTSRITRPDHFISSASVPANLNKLNGNAQLSQSSKTNSPTRSLQNGSPVGIKNKKNQDDELFEFLNNPNASVENGNGKKKEGAFKPVTNGKHSRQSSTSSLGSHKSHGSSRTPDPHSEGDRVTPLTNSGSDDVDTSSHPTDPSDDLLGNTGSSSGYHSNSEDNNQQQQQLSSLELENKLLKNEVSSLNQEMTSVIKRAKDAHQELQGMREKMRNLQQQLSQSEQIARELRAQEGDMMEALKAKDSQLAVLRVRLEDTEKELREKVRSMDGLKNEKDRILADHTSSSGVQSHALESLKEKLAEAEEVLRRERGLHEHMQQEALQRQNELEQQKQNLSESLSAAQRKAQEEKARSGELAVQLKTVKTQAETARQELSEYKDKATRILQSKDKLIASLKEGSSSGDGDSSTFSAELEEAKHEKDLLREELRQSKMLVENIRVELQDTEGQLQNEIDSLQDEMRNLQEQLSSEQRRREEAEQELNKLKQEMKYSSEELLHQKMQFQNRLHDRDTEIERLRNQLTTKTVSTSQAELENRLHSLTESLIQKQTLVEALSTEKNSLFLQLERLENNYKELQACTSRAATTSVHMNEEDDVRQRLPYYMKESPMDNNMTRRVKMAANSIDKFSVRLGVFLRRYPMARIFVIVYMCLLHLWVMIVLLTYQPEMHGSDFKHPTP